MLTLVCISVWLWIKLVWVKLFVVRLSEKLPLTSETKNCFSCVAALDWEQSPGDCHRSLFSLHGPCTPRLALKGHWLTENIQYIRPNGNGGDHSILLDFDLFLRFGRTRAQSEPSNPFQGYYLFVRHFNTNVFWFSSLSIAY